jgi:DNA helicase II / ATP-dependent DNA helicase PcrA
MTLPYLNGLDTYQTKAVLADPVPTKVLAGAGSGKTRVLTCRVAHQIDTKQAEPAKMFVTAFTRAAANEFQERVSQIVSAPDLKVGTFHGLMWRLLNSEREMAGMEPLELCKDHERTRLLQGLLGTKTKDFPEAINIGADIAVVSSYIGQWKNALIRHDGREMAETLMEAIEGSEIWCAATIYPLYERRLKDLGKMDFDDMLMKSYELLASSPDALARARAKWDAFFIDEAQDTNHAQWEIVRLLADPKANPNITIVGDTRQALYRFRGAEPEKMAAFKQMYPQANEIDLIMNYRSTPEVIEHANRLVKGFKLSSQSPHRPSGNSPIALSVPTTTDQAIETVSMVQAVRDAGRPGGDVAILIRTNAQSADIESAFVAAKLPYWCNGGGFFDRMEVGDMMAYLRLALDHTDATSLARIINKPTRYLGRAYVDKVVQASSNYEFDLVDTMKFVTKYTTKSMFAKQLEAAMDLSDLINSISPDDGSFVSPALAIQKIMKETDYLEWLRKTSGTSEGADDSRKENIDVLIETASRFGSIAALVAFADEASALQEQSGDATEICTVHRAKGREWPIVVATNFYHDSIPHKNADGPHGYDDERRIAYVAYTRARDQLVVMAPEMNEKGFAVRPSPFIRDSGLKLETLEPETTWYDSILH